MNQIIISDGRGTQAVILPEKGATVISLTKNGREFLYCDEDNLRSAERPRCGIPFLFPIFGREVLWQGENYSIVKQEASADKKHLRIYDEVIVKGKNLYDGKFIN